MQVNEVLEEIVKVCRKHAAEKVILFGSRAKGTAQERSDIDIAVVGAADFGGLQEEIEEIPTLYSIDLVELETCGNDLLMEDIERYGRKIYEKIDMVQIHDM